MRGEEQMVKDGVRVSGLLLQRKTTAHLTSTVVQIDKNGLVAILLCEQVVQVDGSLLDACTARVL